MHYYYRVAYKLFIPSACSNTTFTYNYNKGPCHNPEDVLRASEGNCRLALQYYFYVLYRTFLPPKEVLPDQHWSSRTFVSQQSQPVQTLLQPHDVLYAECTQTSTGKRMYRDRSRFETRNDWLIKLHTAIYIGEVHDQLRQLMTSSPPPTERKLVWHANHMDGTCGLWPLEKFQEYYNIVGVRRIPTSGNT